MSCTCSVQDIELAFSTLLNCIVVVQYITLQVSKSPGLSARYDHLPH